MPAISANGWRTDVSGGDIQRDNGISSKPTRLNCAGTCRPPRRAASNHAHRLQVTAGEYRRRAVFHCQHFGGVLERRFDVEVPPAHQIGVDRQASGAHRRTVTVHPGVAAEQVTRAGDDARSARGPARPDAGSQHMHPTSWWHPQSVRSGQAPPEGRSLPRVCLSTAEPLSLGR